jgi:hypothetical protein
MVITLLHFWVRPFLFRVNYVPDSARSGQISASLSAMQRTIDDYDSMAKREMIKLKQEKASL